MSTNATSDSLVIHALEAISISPDEVRNWVHTAHSLGDKALIGAEMAVSVVATLAAHEDFQDPNRDPFKPLVFDSRDEEGTYEGFRWGFELFAPRFRVIKLDSMFTHISSEERAVASHPDTDLELINRERETTTDDKINYPISRNSKRVLEFTVIKEPVLRVSAI